MADTTCPACGGITVPWVVQTGFHTPRCIDCGASGLLVSDEAEALREDRDRLSAQVDTLRAVGGQLIRYGTASTGVEPSYYAALGDWEQLAKGDLHGDGYAIDYAGSRWDQAQILCDRCGQTPCCNGSAWPCGEGADRG